MPTRTIRGWYTPCMGPSSIVALALCYKKKRALLGRVVINLLAMKGIQSHGHFDGENDENKSRGIFTIRSIPHF